MSIIENDGGSIPQLLSSTLPFIKNEEIKNLQSDFSHRLKRETYFGKSQPTLSSACGGKGSQDSNPSLNDEATELKPNQFRMKPMVLDIM
ncbi:MAG: hypothetical protein ABFS39_08170 [Pseudomonadota bacterium]